MPLSDSLIAWWSLEEASGTRVDAHGNNDLTDNNTVTQTTGKVANCAQFASANSEYLNIADNADLSMGDIDFTIAFWINLTTKSAVATPINKYQTSGNQREYQLTYQNGTDRFRWDVSPNGTTTGVTTISADTLGSPSTGTWYFIVVWHDSVNNQIGISGNAGTANTASHSAGVFNGTSEFRLGINAASSNPLNGLMDEVGVWKRVLSGAEITELYNGGSGRDYAYITSAAGKASPFMARPFRVWTKRR